MGVPTSGNFSMFGSGDNSTVAGAIVEGGADSGTVAGTTDFNTLKGLADISRFDVTYSEGASSLAQITKTSQFRGYPIPTTTTTTSTTVAPCTLTIYFNTAATPSPGGWDSQTEACQGTGTALTVYLPGPTCPVNFNEASTAGKKLYTDSALTTPLNGSNKWFKDVSGANTGQAIQVGSDGAINQIGTCSAPTTTTTTAAPTTTTTTTAAATTTTTTTAAATTTTTTAAAGSNITLNLNSDTTSIGDVRLQYTRTNNAAATRTVSDTDNTIAVNLTDTVTNAKDATTMTAIVNKYSSGTTLEVGAGTVVPKVQLIVNINGSDVYDQTLDTGPLTLNYGFTFNITDTVIVTAEITSV